LPHIGVDDAGFNCFASQRLLTAGATAVGRGSLGVGGGLPGEGLSEDLFGQDFAEVEQEMFDLGEGGSPGGPVRAVELIDQVFGHALDVGPHFFYQWCALLGSRHP
jgi:hypothetical protein